ncbi:homeobox protein Mix.1-like [Discoglossus pictus]
MAGFPNQIEDFYSPNFACSVTQMEFNGQLASPLGMDISSIQGNEFQLKEDPKAQTGPKTVQLNNPPIDLQQVPVPSSSAPDPVPLSHRRKRTVYSSAQLEALEQFFQINMYPDIHHREYLSKHIHLPESRIQVWFQNRRAKARRRKNQSKKFPVFEEHYPTMPGVNAYMYPSASPRHIPGALFQQQQMMIPQQHVPPHLSMPQDRLQHSPESMPCPESSCAVAKQRLLMQQATSGNYLQSMPTTSSIGNQQNFNVSPSGGFKENLMHMNARTPHIPTMPTHSNLKMDYDNFSPIRPEMSQISDSTNPTTHGRRNMFTPQKTGSPYSDSGVSKGSPESESEWEANMSSVLHSLKQTEGQTFQGPDRLWSQLPPDCTSQQVPIDQPLPPLAHNQSHCPTKRIGPCLAPEELSKFLHQRSRNHQIQQDHNAQSNRIVTSSHTQSMSCPVVTMQRLRIQQTP